MREIKFRVWGKTEKKFKYYDFQELCFSQYTGLKDKNGVEIYEGDICEDEYKCRYLIIYHKEFASFMVSKIDQDDINYSKIPADSFIVIGNKYENPKLLEKKND